MQIGAVGAMSYTPYIYNTNTVNRASMNKISGISDDLLESKTDFSALSNETTNPIKRGQSLDFTGILQMQMSMSRLNASRLMKSPEADEEARQAAGIKPVSDDAVSQITSAENTAQVANASSEVVSSVASENEANQTASTFDYARAMAAYQPIDMYA